MLHNPQHRQNVPLVQYPQVCGGPVGSAPDLYFDLEAKAGWKIVRSVWPAAALVLGCESRELSHPTHGKSRGACLLALRIRLDSDC